MSLTTQKEKKREFLPENFKITVWSKLRPYYNELSQRPISSILQLEKWIFDRTELRNVLKNEFQLRHTQGIEESDEKMKDLFEYAVQELAPRIDSMEVDLNKKLSNCPYRKNLEVQKYASQLEMLKNKFEVSANERVQIKE